MNDTFTKDQVLNAYNNAPDFVRSAFNDEKTTQVVVDLRARFQLHIDRAGILGKEVGYLLLGLTDPSKFVNRLKSNNFPDQMVDAIVAEINQKIFIPIREQMKSKSGSAPVPTPPPLRPASVGVPRYVPPATVLPPQKSYAPPPQSPRYANQQDDASVNAFVRRVEPRPAAPSVSVITPPPAPPAPQRPPQPPPAARPMPPPNLPGALPPQSDIIPPTPKAPAPASSSLDPYREPL